MVQTTDRFVGFDTGAEVFLKDGRVFRGIYPGKEELYEHVLGICTRENLFQFGIVATHELTTNLNLQLPYAWILEHERIPFISYPHEWPASMLKEAALFHLRLFSKLGEHGLTFKDWHPYNILFRGTKPVFVDFSSIIPHDKLLEEAYLTPPRVPATYRRIWDRVSGYYYEMYRRMYEPYFLWPLYMMHYKRHVHARERILKTYLDTLAPGELPVPIGRKYRLFGILKKLALIQPGKRKTLFLSMLHQEMERLSVARPGYLDYYAAKDEDFTFTPSTEWNNKQKVVYEAIQQRHPHTLLDIGSNTGWFSILAAQNGCEVVAMDIDDACMDALYQRAQKEDLPILPLVANLNALTPDIAPPLFENEPSLSLIGGEAPLLIAAEKRFRCEMVLALALIHHLVLGQGMLFEQVVGKLNALTEKVLLLEFVARDDRLIVAEPSFFRAYQANASAFDWYTLENLINELKRVFRTVIARPSHPVSRTLLICEK